MAQQHFDRLTALDASFLAQEGGRSRAVRTASPSSMSSKSRREAASQPETTFRRSNVRLTRERGLSRRRTSAVSARQAPGKRTMRRSSRFREGLGWLYCTRVATTSCISPISISPRLASTLRRALDERPSSMLD